MAAGPGGSLAAAKSNADKNKGSTGKGSGAGSNALASAGSGNQTGRLDRDQQADVGGRLSGTSDTGAPGGKTTASGGAGTAALSAPQAAPDGMTLQQRIDTNFKQAGEDFDHGVRGDPSSADTYDSTGRLKTMGTSPYVSDPSIGQLVGAGLTAAPIAGSLNNAVGAGESALDGGKFGDSYDGGAIGRLIDGMRGVQPGPVTGFTGSRVSSSTNSRGGELSSVDDPRLADRASAAATNALTGDAPTVGAGTDALFSDVALTDRRKPRSDLAGTNMLLKAA